MCVHQVSICSLFPLFTVFSAELNWVWASRLALAGTELTVVTSCTVSPGVVLGSWASKGIASENVPPLLAFVGKAVRCCLNHWGACLSFRRHRYIHDSACLRAAGAPEYFTAENKELIYQQAKANPDV